MSGDVLTRPDFVVIGAMKCATSTLHEQLARQPGIWMSTPKEPNFFSDDAAWGRGLDWYRRLFARAPAGHLTGESSTHYTKLPTHPDALPRIRRHLPHARLVYVMRDPVERIVSQYVHEWSIGALPREGSIDDALRTMPELVDYSRYDMQIAPYLDAFGASAVLPVFFERLVRYPQDELRRVCAHVGYDGEPHWQEESERENVSSARLRRPRLLQGLLQIESLKPIRRMLVPEAIRSRIRARWSLGGRPRPSERSIEWLHAELDPDMRRLGERLGLDLSCAGFAETVSLGPAPEWRT